MSLRGAKRRGNLNYVSAETSRIAPKAQPEGEPASEKSLYLCDVPNIPMTEGDCHVAIAPRNDRKERDREIAKSLRSSH